MHQSQGVNKPNHSRFVIHDSRLTIHHSRTQGISSLHSQNTSQISVLHRQQKYYMKKPTIKKFHLQTLLLYCSNDFTRIMYINPVNFKFENHNKPDSGKRNIQSYNSLSKN